MEWVADRVCWCPEHQVLINWEHGLPLVSAGMNSYLWHAQLILVTAADDPACLIVQKDRLGHLTSHENALNAIFEEYDMDHEHYRGRVLLSPTELTRWRMMLL